MDLLRQFQTERKAARKEQMEQAMLLAQQSLIKGLPYNPVNDGFVYSTSEINREIDRTSRLNEARRIDPNTPKPKKQPFSIAA